MSKRYARQLHSADGLIAAVEQHGFLPFFRNEIHGFSIEELCPPALWFADDVDGPWEWKGPAARSGKCLYGKLFNKKAGFVSREWIPDFANFRRDGYDFDARWDDGLASYKDKELYEAIAGEGRMLSKRLKEALNYRKGGNTGFETCITRLQMQSYVCIADFVYMQDKKLSELLGIPELSDEEKELALKMKGILDRIDEETRIDRTTAFRAVLDKMTKEPEENWSLHYMATLLEALLYFMLNEGNEKIDEEEHNE